MIIDSHTHIGTIQYSVGKNRVSNLPKQDLITALNKYSINFALVSSIEGAEFNSVMQLVPRKQQIPQLQSMKHLIEFVINNKFKLKALLWVKPYNEKCNDKLEHFILKNKKYIAGLKMHPTLSNLKFTDNHFYPFFKLASKYKLPIQVHSENDGKSNVKFIYNIAQKYRDVIFIMVHMGLKTDTMEAINIIRRNDNIYGDICSVENKNIFKAICECGSNKILFGTDAIVNGIDTYEKYLPIIKYLKEKLKREDAENVLYKNCMRIYNLNVKD